MDRGVIILGLCFILVGLPVIFGAAQKIYKRQLRFKEKQLSWMAQDAETKAAAYAAQIQQLEQRVRILEQIATDRGTQLSAEIESLRDAPPR